VEPDEQGQWLSLAELAARSGAHIDRIRSWYKRASRAGKVQSRKGNDGQIRVWATADLPAQLGLAIPESDPAAGRASGSAALAEAELVAELRARSAELADRAGRAESDAIRWRREHDEQRREAERLRADLAGLAGRVEAQDRLVSALESEIRHLRKPAWKRWLGVGNE
jgi:hypothetical protein